MSVTSPETLSALAKGQVPGVSTSSTSSSSSSSLSTQLTNPSFETGSFSGWTLSGAGGVISSFGSLAPPDGSFMALVHTGTGTILSGCSTGKDCTKSTLSQDFNAKSIVTISGKVAFLSNEFPSVTGTGAVFKDRYLFQITDSTNKAFTILDTTVADLNSQFTANPSSVTAAGFTLSQGAGRTGFTDFGKKTFTIAEGKATLSFAVSNVSDSAVDSAFLLDAVLLTQDPPLFYITGGTFARSGALLALANDRLAVDSVMMVCCGGQATLDGPVLAATNSTVDAPFGALSVIQGGRLTSTGSGALVQLDGGTYTLGTITGVFDVAGSDPNDAPLRHGGAFLDAANATINTGNIMIVDTALLQASAPLVNLRNSTLTTNDSGLDLAFRANVTSVGPTFALDRSTLTVGSGALVNIRNGSSLVVTGDLVRLANGSTLNVLNGPLASVSGNSLLSVSGGLVAFSGGGNALNISNNLCSIFGCANIGGLTVALTGGATAANVSITNAIKGTGAVNIAPSAAAVLVSGAGGKVNVGN